MTTEREELRLTVSLVDNVSAGLNKIKGEFKDLTEGGGKQHAERFKRENTEAIAILKRMTGEAGEAYKAFGMMRLGALGAAGGVALLGYEVAKQVKEWGELAEKVRAANQVARAFGIDPGRCAISRSSSRRPASRPSSRKARSPSSSTRWASCSATRRSAQTSCSRPSRATCRRWRRASSKSRKRRPQSKS